MKDYSAISTHKTGCESNSRKISETKDGFANWITVTRLEGDDKLIVEFSTTWDKAQPGVHQVKHQMFLTQSQFDAMISFGAGYSNVRT